ncbi:MAG: type II toxin-antitoxin system VapC family toxin [Pseudomonadota bacterium]
MSFVVDCSVALAWFAPDEEFTDAEDLYADAIASGALVPFHWRAEFANGLLMMVRRKRAGQTFPAAAFASIEKLTLEIDYESLAQVDRASMSLAIEHDLTIYDSIYLETALRRAVPLATLDKKLAGAARKEGLSVLGLRPS